MWAFLTLVFQRLFTEQDAQYATIQKQLEQLMKVAEQIQADLEAVKANLVETQGDLAEVLALNKTQSEQIEALDASVVALKAELGAKIDDLQSLDAIAAQVAEIKATSRAIADVVPEPAPEPTPEPPAE